MVKHCILVLVISILHVQNVHTGGLGKCPKVNYMEHFNSTRFTGRWYEIERSFYLLEILSSCVTIDLDRNSTEKVNIAVVSRSRWSGNVIVSEGFATETKKDPSVYLYKVSSKLPRILNKYLPGSGLYQIVTTDYDHYAVIWSCTDYAVAHTDLVWIWGRDREFNVTMRAHIYGLMSEKHIDSERLILPKNSNCTS